jgi:hypothetical protein
MTGCELGDQASIPGRDINIDIYLPCHTQSCSTLPSKAYREILYPEIKRPELEADIHLYIDTSVLGAVGLDGAVLSYLRPDARLELRFCLWTYLRGVG